MQATAILPSKGNWSSEQLKLAFHFYCQTPFGKLHSHQPADHRAGGIDWPHAQRVGDEIGQLCQP